jgi:hypothetical protein
VKCTALAQDFQVDQLKQEYEGLYVKVFLGNFPRIEFGNGFIMMYNNKRQSDYLLLHIFLHSQYAYFICVVTNPLKYGGLLCHIDFQLNIKTDWTRLIVHISKCGEAKLVS